MTTKRGKKNKTEDNVLADFDLNDPKFPKSLEKRTVPSGNYPYTDTMKKKKYYAELEELQIELVKLQRWIRDTNERIICVFEGRDAAGKGGSIGRFRQYLNPRHARIVALAKPTDVERGQWYFQRYVAHLPTSGEIVLFDRSWYNRAGVEPVMGFCKPEQTASFLKEAPQFERGLVAANIRVFKFWLNIGREMQIKRFHDRRHNPLKVWKLSPIDLAALEKWDDYTVARDRMLDATHTDHAPWTIIRANCKKRARLNLIRHVLLNVDYEGRDLDVIGEVDPNILGHGSDFVTGA